MAKQTINRGSAAGDGTGEHLYDAFGKVNDNFTELYAAVGAGSATAAFTGASAAGPAAMQFAEDTDNGAHKVTLKAPASIAADVDVTLPGTADTLIGRATIDTLTNKTLTAPTLTGPIVQTSAMDLQVGQIAFPATQNASSGANTLDDYEEGTYTPAWTGGSPTIGNGTIVGTYIKIGKLVLTHIGISMGSTTTFGSGSYSFSLPFAAADTRQLNGAGCAYILDSGSNTFIAGTVHNGASSIVLVYSGTGNVGASIPMTWAANDTLDISVSYMAAA